MKITHFVHCIGFYEEKIQERFVYKTTQNEDVFWGLADHIETDQIKELEFPLKNHPCISVLLHEDTLFYDISGKYAILILKKGKCIPCEASSDKVQVGPGDAILLCNAMFKQEVNEIEVELDFCKSADPEEWVKTLGTRWLMKTQPKENGSLLDLAAIWILQE